MMAVVVSSMVMGIPAGIVNKKIGLLMEPRFVKSAAHLARILSHDCRESCVRSFDFAQDDTDNASRLRFEMAMPAQWPA